ncbi:rhomboid family intramembrane serine protease [uncultured Amnibacterium sp.]|uniref:rhomboid family intramembrane serine protease n=1 Tax=uncultured Amnibacterium sp. TaxID=1631851 RepID=UPI0035CA4823
METDPSVCYRHPGRQSWVLCQRCGRTVCPECQIQAPVGVHCPECVAETSGGVAWRPASNVTPLEKPKRRRRPRAQARVQSLLSPRGVELSAATVILGVAIALWVVGSFTIVPVQWLAALSSSTGLSPLPLPELQLWRYLTAPVVTSAGSFSLQSALFFALSAVFFWFTAPQLERMLGTRTFLLVVGTAAVVGNAGMVIATGAGLGLSTIVFGCFAALLVVVWQEPQMRTQILIMIGINLLISLVFGGQNLPALIGGMVGGAGALHLLRSGPDRGWKQRTPLLIIGAVGVGLVLVATLRAVL